MQELSYDTCPSASHELFDFLAGCHRSVARGRGGKCAVGCSVFNGLLRIIEFEKTEREPACETVPAPYAIEDLQLWVFAALEKLDLIIYQRGANGGF